MFWSSPESWHSTVCCIILCWWVCHEMTLSCLLMPVGTISANICLVGFSGGILHNRNYNRNMSSWCLTCTGTRPVRHRLRCPFPTPRTNCPARLWTLVLISNLCGPLQLMSIWLTSEHWILLDIRNILFSSSLQVLVFRIIALLNLGIVVLTAGSW